MILRNNIGGTCIILFNTCGILNNLNDYTNKIIYLLSKEGEIMGKDLVNPNSIQALNEMKTEIANELGISNFESLQKNQNNATNGKVNKKLVERYRNNLIGFK